MHRLRGLLLEERDRRGGGGDLGGGALHVQLGRESRIEEPSCEVERPLLRLDVLIRQRDPLLEAAVGDVLDTHLAHERDQDRVPVVRRSLDGSNRYEGFARIADFLGGVGRQHGDLGQRLGIGIDVDGGIGEEQV